MRRLLLSLALCSVAAAQPRPSAGRFPEIVLPHFATWDADANGTLSPQEIDRLVVSPDFAGKEAAALAAMKLLVRSTKIKPPELTREFIANNSTDPAGELLDQSGTDERGAPTGGRPPSSLQRRYESAFRKITNVKRDLFLDETPDIDRCRQGPLGDCFVVAGIGAMVHRDPASVKRMITPHEDGSYTVVFGGKRDVRISALTDAQFALTSSTGDEGYWLAVLEKAYGALRNSARPADRRTQEDTDAISRGGSLGSTLRELTGNPVTRVTLRSRAKTDESAAAVANQLRKALITATQARRIAGASTGSDTLPPGISPKHAYAILGFDESTNTLSLWNPHSNSHRVRGEAGMESGYPTRAGRFDIPLADFVRIFSSAVVETADADEGETSPKSSKG